MPMHLPYVARLLDLLQVYDVRTFSCVFQVMVPLSGQIPRRLAGGTSSGSSAVPFCLGIGTIQAGADDGATQGTARARSRP